jgi:phosphopantothenoylcysteine decarboxylase/phosphopantothenoylcysteine decarboxylase/phosphopantothenate--cysteine ligase
VVTENSLNIISPLTFETLTGSPCYHDSFVRSRREMGHITLKENANLFLICPATANVIGKIANGIADDLLTTTYLSVTCPVIVAPSMNPAMYSHLAVQENIERLIKRGVHIIEPREGKVVCGASGKGKLSDISEIFKKAMDVVKN